MFVVGQLVSISSDGLDQIDASQMEIDELDADNTDENPIPNDRPMRRFIDLGGVTSALTGLFGLGNMVGNVVGNAVGQASGGVMGMGSGGVGMNGGFSFGGNVGGNAGGSLDGYARGSAAGNAGGYAAGSAGGNAGGYSSGQAYPSSDLGSGQYQTNNMAMSNGRSQFENPYVNRMNPSYSQLHPDNGRLYDDQFVASGYGGALTNMREQDLRIPSVAGHNYGYTGDGVINPNSFVPPPPPAAGNGQPNIRKDITIGSDGTSYSASDIDGSSTIDGRSQYGSAMVNNRNDQSGIRQEASGTGHNVNEQSIIRQNISPRSQRKRMRTSPMRRAGSDLGDASDQPKPIETQEVVNVNNELKNDTISSLCGRPNRFDVSGNMERRLKGIQLMEDFIRTFKLMLLTLLD